MKKAKGKKRSNPADLTRRNNNARKKEISQIIDILEGLERRISILEIDMRKITD